MALIGKSFGRGFGSTKKVSAYQQMQQWKARQKAHSQKFLNQQAVASNVFAVGVSETQTATQMLFNNVAKRVQNEAKAKLAQQNGAIDNALDSLKLGKSGDKKTGGVDVKV
jgi:hypothetical protein